MIPRAARNNNPGNLEGGAHWDGLMPLDGLTGIQTHERFAVFKEAKWGFRALVTLLKNYKMLHGADTVQKIIDRFAPPNENNTTAYVRFVSERVGVQPNTQINVTIPKIMFDLAKSIAIYETGSWEPYWHNSELLAGMKLAGFEVGDGDGIA